MGCSWWFCNDGSVNCHSFSVGGKEFISMKRIVLLFAIAILLVGCGEKQVSPEVQARRESREAAKKERDESREAAKESRESLQKAREESKAIAEAEDKAMHDKYDKVIIDNDVVKITLTTKMTSHGGMPCIIKNKTNKDITLIVFPTYIKTYKSDEEIYNEHTDVFPRTLKSNEEVESTFHVTFHKNDNLGIAGYDDYFDSDNKVHFRTKITVNETLPEGTTDGETIKKYMDNHLVDDFMEFDVYKAD